MPAILKQCPSCGRRFEVHRTGEEKISSEREVILVSKPQRSMSQEMPRDAFTYFPLPDKDLSIPPKVEPIPAEKDVIEDSYTCKHCGHSWMERREVFKDEHGRKVNWWVVGEGAP